MLKRGISQLFVVPVIMIGLTLLGTGASALPALLVPDLDPFVLREDYWSAAIVRYPDGRVEPGSTTYRIEYADRRNWTVTQLSHTADPSLAGTTWHFDGTTLTELTRGRKLTLPEPDAVNNWIRPGLLEALSRKPGATVRENAIGRRQITWLEQTASGQSQRTVATFDISSRLPVSIEEWSGDTLVRRMTFTTEGR